jgi:hypothetical protein
MVPFIAPAVNAYFQTDKMEELKLNHHLELLEKATSKFPAGFAAFEHPFRHQKSDSDKPDMLTAAERSGLLALHTFLREQDPHHEKLGLKRIPTYTGEFRWLCDKHYKDSLPKIPDKIE